MTHRRIGFMVVTVLAFVVLSSHWALRGADKQPSDQPSVAELVKEIKLLRQRIVALEKRVAKLEPHGAPLHADKRGVLYDAEDVPVGYWGVDFEPADYSR